MNLQGWVPIYRKTLENEIFKHDKNAWNVFFTLLLLVNKETGQWEGGRFQLAEWCGLKPITTYKSLKRLKKHKMVTQVSNNRFSIISICNWHKYQLDGNNVGNNTVTTGEQLGNTTTISNNKELRIVTNVTNEKSFGNIELNNLISFSKQLGFPLQGTIRTNRYNANHLLKKYGLEKSKKIVRAAVEVKAQEYAPVINDFSQLYRKVGDLAAFYQKQTNKKGIIYE